MSYPGQLCCDSIHVPQWIEEAVQEAVAVFIVCVLCLLSFSNDWLSKMSLYVNALKLFC